MVSVLRVSANVPYSDLVTRPTGAAVRRCIETEIASVGDGETVQLDFSHIGMMDYSCADEVVAKLLLADDGTTPRVSQVVFHGLTDMHLEAIEHVLQHHGLALVVHFADGGMRLVGEVTDDERHAWDAVHAHGASAADDVAATLGLELESVRSALDSLFRRRLLRLDGATYAPVGSLQ
jgi:hypothetical protein